MRRLVAGVVMLMVVAATPEPGTAQIGGSCRPELVEGGAVRRIRVGTGRFRAFWSGGVLARCIGQPTTIRADSVAWYQDLGRMDFEGVVRFRDSTTRLESDRARYFPNVERLNALGNVRLVDESTGSVLTGTNLTYYRIAPGIRDTSELYATERPMVEYRRREAPQEEPYVINGDRVRLKGDGLAWAGGAVTIDREDFAARGDSAALNMDVGEGLLIGDAEAAGRDSTGYTIRGKRIAFRLLDGELHWVQAQRQAEATSAEWEARGDTIEFNIAHDRLQGGAVWGDSTRARAVSASQTIEGDSLAIDAPDQLLAEVRAFGATRATSATDSLSAGADWIGGDTLVARFDSSETGRRVLVMLQAHGNAQALYHVYAQEGEVGPPAINYARGKRITAWFENEELDRVNIVEQADGVYLEPVGRRRP